MADIIPRGGRLIGNIIPDIVIEENTTDGWEITSHPVQQGASISDHKYRKPISLKMSMMYGGGDSSALGATYQKLLDLQATSVLFDVMTPKRIYKNMQISSLSCTTNQQTENVLAITGEFIEVNIVDVVVSSVPPRAKHKNPAKTGKTAKTGAKSTKEVKKTDTVADKSTILNSLKGMF
jgi:hypothetical protein